MTCHKTQATILLWHDVCICASQRNPLFVLAWNPQDFLGDQKRTRKGKVWRQSTEVRGRWWLEKWLLSKELGLVDPEAGLANVRGWVSVPGGCIGILLGYTLAIARSTENHTKVSQTSPFLHLELTQVRDRLFFFSFTLSVVYVMSCVFVKLCEMPQAGDERNH